MQSLVLLKFKLRRHLGGLASHNSALRIIRILHITAKFGIRTGKDHRT
jgi:hypothetical protein